MVLGPFITTVIIAQALRFTRFAALGVFGHVALLDTKTSSRLYTLIYTYIHDNGGGGGLAGSE